MIDTLLAMFFGLIVIGLFFRALEYVFGFAVLVTDIISIVMWSPIAFLIACFLLANTQFILLLNFLAFWIPIKFITSNWLKGKIGEYRVSKAILINFDVESYRLINDVTLSTEHGTTQIDHIVVSRNGIFVIETKNLRGKIFGSNSDYKWTQKIGKSTYKFYSPLKQNSKHLDVLSSSLLIERSKFVSMVVFVGATVETAYKLPITITTLKSMPKLISSYTYKTLTTDEIDQVVNKIESIRRKPGLITDLSHVLNLKLYKLRSFVLR